MTFPLPNANPVWPHFQTLCAIPRSSKHEGALREQLIAWAQQHQLAWEVDKAGNLVIRKPATLGMQDRPGVVLQGHLDMVCQQNQGTGHDFYRDPIVPRLQDGWLIAEHTTLGADNGIGVAMALAVLQDDGLAHPPLEALFTIDEEMGMSGALQLDPTLLQGRRLINIDTEEWGEFYLGCAGGVDVNIAASYFAEPMPADYFGLELVIKGLRGGHSGVDIHEERGNAIKLMLRVLVQLGRSHGLRLASLLGGTARNALSREASALVAVAADQLDGVRAELDRYQQLLRFELAGVDEGVCVLASAANVTEVVCQADQNRLLAALHAAPHGVRRMSRRVPGVVETSNNLGVVRIEDGQFTANCMVRSLLGSGTQSLADEIRSLFELAGATVSSEGGYPGWAPNPESALLQVFTRVYQEQFGTQAQVKVIHAGLECGILGDKYPGMDMVSFGPNIRGAHAPGERVEVASVDKCWELLKAVLAAC